VVTQTDPASYEQLTLVYRAHGLVEVGCSACRSESSIGTGAVDDMLAEITMFFGLHAECVFT
jgi:hypothetical protein